MNPSSGVVSMAMVCPVPSPVEGVSVVLRNTGDSNPRRSLVLDDDLGGTIPMVYTVGHIRHPNGDVFVDAGLGKVTRDGSYPFWSRPKDQKTVGPGMALVEQIGGSPDTVLLTHMHLDHIAGLLDFDGTTEVWTTAEEWRTARTSNVAFNPRRFQQAVRFKPVDVRAGQAQQQLEKPAIDVKGDGTIWYLSTPGHTPGSASVLVRATDQVWLFIGDIAWMDEHLEHAHRPKLVSLLVDGRPREQRVALEWARIVKEQCPSINVVAAHEPRWYAK